MKPPPTADRSPYLALLVPRDRIPGPDMPLYAILKPDVATVEVPTATRSNLRAQGQTLRIPHLSRRGQRALSDLIGELWDLAPIALRASRITAACSTVDPSESPAVEAAGPAEAFMVDAACQTAKTLRPGYPLIVPPAPHCESPRAQITEWLLRSVIALDDLMTEKFCEHVGDQDAAVIRDARNAMANAVDVKFKHSKRPEDK